MRPLGVGLVYLAELDALFREGNADLSVLELEPETFWEKVFPEGPGGAPAYLPNGEAMSRIASLPQHKLVHSVGFPVGGTQCCGGDYVTPLSSSVQQLGASWVSEHLSFNTIADGSGQQQIGFLLPPRQTQAGVDVAVRNLRRLSAQMPAPFAFETGVNYLQPRGDELSDGEFFARVAEGADCGILLDLHNLWANERNGRQPLDAVLDELPLERVWEVHLAGGMLLDGLYLDAHSGAVAPGLLDIAARVLPRLPNVGAVLFEILPGYVPQLGLDGVRAQILELAQLWRLRPAERIVVPRSRSARTATLCTADDVARWECDVGSLAVGHATNDKALAFDLAADPGVPVLRRLIGEFRSGRVARALHFTTILMLSCWGPERVHALLRAYESSCYPDVFTSGEADRFAAFLRDRLDRLPPTPFLAAVLRFEHALVRAALYGERSRIEWDIDPGSLFDALDAGQLPKAAPVPRFTMEIVPR